MRASRAPVLLAILLLAGCAGGRLDNARLQTDVAAGRFDAALELLEKGSADDVSVLLDRGLVLGALGRFDESNEAFARAEQLIDDLYTRSLSQEALSLLTSDLAVDYRASGYEHAYVAYYRAWNYLQLGQVEDVLVEARVINERLNFRSDSCPDRGGACGHDVFLRYFSGLLFEWGGAPNDAYVAYKQADLARATLQERFGAAPPADLGVRLVRLGFALGFDEEARGHAAAWNLDPEAARRGPASSVVVLFENGMVARREETSITVPIFKGETEEIRRDRDRWAHTLAGRYRQDVSGRDLEYLLHVALPVLVDRPPAAASAEFSLGSARGETRLVAPLSAMAAAALDEAMGGITVRAVTRALVKYLAKETAEDRSKVAGFLVNLLGVVTEQADTRSWRSLPHEIQVVTLDVEPGTWDGTLTVRAVDGKELETRRFTGIRVPAGGVAFVRHRSGL